MRVSRGLIGSLAVSAALVVICADGAGAAARSGNPFASNRFWVDRSSQVAQLEREWRTSRPADAALLAKIAQRPFAHWHSSSDPGWTTALRRDVRRARRAHALSVLVGYHIPVRDCRGLAGGGASDGRKYLAWIRRYARAIGKARAAVVLEPDALANSDCLTPALRRQRFRLITKAVKRIGRQPHTSVYIDAGNSGWRPPDVMATRLRKAGIRYARGFALNVSNFQTTADSIAYGRKINRRLPRRRPFIIDTSRNGNGPLSGPAWCNPRGRALGEAPTGRTGRRMIDAYFWIKPPGYSDGSCNGGPGWGLWPDYALELAHNAHW